MNIAMIDVNYFFNGVVRHVRSVDRTRLAAWLRAAYPINTLNVYYGYSIRRTTACPTPIPSTAIWPGTRAKKVFGAR